MVPPAIHWQGWKRLQTALFLHALIVVFPVQIHTIGANGKSVNNGGTANVAERGSSDDDNGGERILLHNTAAFGEQLWLVDEDTSVEQLALTESDVQYLGVAVAADTGYIYFTTSTGEIRRASSALPTSSPWQVTTVMNGRVTVRVTGYNLGASLEDVALLSIKGVPCSTMRRESSNNLLCTSGHPTLTTDGAEGIRVNDVIVQTQIGGWTAGEYPGDFAESALADHSLKPIITGVQIWASEIGPHALAFDHSNGYLYYSDTLARSIERISIVHGADGEEASTVVVAVEWSVFLPDAGLVHGMALDPYEGENGGYLYFSDAQGGTISRIELNSFSTAVTNDNAGIPEPWSRRKEVIASGLVDPMGVALEPNNGPRVFFTLYGGSIRAVARNGAGYVGGRRSFRIVAGDGEEESSSSSDYEIRQFDSGTRLDGIAIAEHDDDIDNVNVTELRLYWSEHGRRPALKRSTLDGTRVQSLSLLPNSPASNSGRGVRDTSANLVWPRAVVFGAGGTSAGLIYSENLGAIRQLPDKAGGVAPITIVEDDSYPAAIAIRTLLWRASKEGLVDKYFTETLR